MSHKKKKTKKKRKISQKQRSSRQDVISAELEKAVRHHQAGKFKEAEGIYKKTLRLNPDHPEALHLSGLAAYQTGRYKTAEARIKQAISHLPENPIYYNSLGAVLNALKRRDEALSCYQKAAELKPDYAEAWNNMGTMFKVLGNPDEAISCYQKAVRFSPDFAEAYYTMGRLFGARGNSDEAISCYQNAVRIRPDFAQAYHYLGILLKDQGKADEAGSCFRRTIELKPENADAHLYLGILLQEAGRADEAFNAYRKAAQIKPDYAEAYNNMGNILQQKGVFREAVSCYQKAVQIKPDYARAFNNMGLAFQNQGESENAISCYQKTLELEPDIPETYCNMGDALQYQGRFEAAVSCYQKTLELRPDYIQAQSRLVAMLQQTCAWKDLEEAGAILDERTKTALAEGKQAVENPLSNLMRHADPAFNFAVAKSWSDHIVREVADMRSGFLSHGKRLASVQRHGGKIRIGYLSHNFSSHPTAHLMVDLYGRHNRDQFEVFCYSYGKDDGSYYRRRIEKDCDHFTDIRDMTYLDAATRIRDDRIDILIDLMGHTQDSRLTIPALRPAKIQVSYLGFLGTTGAGFFDYIITDPIVTPEEDAPFYSEKFVYMPHSYQVNSRVEMTLTSFQRADLRSEARTSFGLPEEGIIFCSFNEPYKIEPVIFDLWMKILRRIPESVLWLVRRNETVVKNLRYEAEERGIDPDRLIFAEKLPLDQHLSRLKLADIMLDTRVYNGGATTSNALWMGVPVITLYGDHFVSRMTASSLNAIGLSELITYRSEEYGALAVRLGRHPDKLLEIKEKLEKNRLTEPLFDTPRFVRNLEKAYNEMWEIYAAGEKPRSIIVNEEAQVSESRSSKPVSVSEQISAETCYDMGIAFKKQGRSEEAISSFQKAVQLKPDMERAYVYLGNLVQAQGRFDEAISYYQKALAIQPDSAATYNNMGNILKVLGRFDDAISCYQKAIQLNPEMASSYNNMATTLMLQGKLAEAVSYYRKTLEMDPDMTQAWPNLFLQLRQLCDWRNMEALDARLDKLTRDALQKGIKPDEMPFLNMVRVADPALNFAVAAAYSADTARRMADVKPRFSFDDRVSGNNRIRVAYLSNDFCNHATSHLMRSLFGLHNRNEFEIFCYSYGKDDGSCYRRKIEQDCDKFADIYDLSYEQGATRIFQDKIDILVDLKGHTSGSRLEIPALRPAPVQVSYLGFPGTTGADFFDYMITDRIVTPPEHLSWYSENLVYMPHCYQINDNTQAISDREFSRTDFRLPQESFIFCSFATAYKIEPVIFDIWMKILKQVPESVLWLLQRHETSARNLKQEAELRGVHPERLIFAEKLPKDEHLGRHRLADLVLDTWIVNGHTTTSDALWAGVPVITLEGKHFASRVSSSILKAAGVGELIADTPEEYEELAAWLAESPEEIGAIRRRLAKNRLKKPLFDTPRFVRNLEKAYKKMWEIFLAGEMPREIHIS